MEARPTRGKTEKANRVVEKKADPDEQTEDTAAKPRRKFGKDKTAQATLFDTGGEQ